MAVVPQLSGPELAPRDGGPARQLVVLLHGVGADGHDLAGLAPIYASTLPGARFVSPHAPEPYDQAPFGRQWFSVGDRQPETRLRGARGAAPLLDAFLDAELAAAGLGDEALALVGFSQGAMMALHIGLRRRRPCAGIIAHSGMLLGERLLADEITARPPVLLTHGGFDDVVPAASLPVAKAALGAAAVPVEAHVLPGLGHAIDEATIRLDLRFLSTIFAAKDPER